MKKIISMLLVLSVIFSLSLSAGAYSGKNLEAPKAGEVVIDGDLSEWDTSKCLRIDSDSQIIDQIEHWDGEADCSVELYAMWDEENLYIAMKILDDTPLVYREGFPLDELDAIILFLSTNPDADPDRTAYEATDWRLVQSADKYKDEYDLLLRAPGTGYGEFRHPHCQGQVRDGRVRESLLRCGLCRFLRGQ